MAEENDKVSNELIFSVLQNMQNDLSIQKEAVRRIDARMGSIESLLGGFHSTLNWHGQELDEHRGQLEGLENQKPDDQS